MVQPNLPEFSSVFLNPRLKPIIKWAGGKVQELSQILPEIPREFNRYYEPFVGGGAVFFSLDRPNMFINDRSNELMNFYKLVKDQNSIFFERLEMINNQWRLIEKVVDKFKFEFIKIFRNFSSSIITKSQMENEIDKLISDNNNEFNSILEPPINISNENFMKEIHRNLRNKVKRMSEIEKEKGSLSNQDILDNIESSLKSAFYMHFRHLYNNTNNYNIDANFATAIFYFIREFCYASMFRYNSRGEFNVPYGGIQYNRKDFLKKVISLKSPEYKYHLDNTRIHNLDFEEFFHLTSPRQHDFVFLDPPYDSDFSTYAKNMFTKDDHSRLAAYLRVCKAKFLLVIKNTDFIFDLYSNQGYKILSFEKKYLVNFQNRNDKNAQHLLIMNYQTGE